MLISNTQRKFLSRIVLLSRRFTSTIHQQNDEYTAVPQYPPILDISPRKKRERQKESEYDGIKTAKTIEEKQIKLNMPRYYGFKCYLLAEDDIPFNNLDFIQHITRTHLIETNNLPDFYKDLEVDSILNNVQSDVAEAFLFECDAVQ